MKKLLLLAGMLVLAWCAGCVSERREVTDKGTKIEHSFNAALFPDCKFSPLQIGVLDQCLVGREADCVVILNPLVLFTEQRSGVVTLGMLGCRMDRNYGLTFALEPFIHSNYGILCGLITGVEIENYGAQIGILNFESIYKLHKAQLCGVNIADRLRAGVVNIHLQKEFRSWLNIGLFNLADSFLDIGLFNVGASTFLQIGLLNYNHNALIPWMVLFNCSFGEWRKPSSEQKHDNTEEGAAIVEVSPSPPDK